MSTVVTSTPTEHGREWSWLEWTLYVAVPIVLLALLLLARYAGGQVSHWVFDSHVGVMETGTGATALLAGAVSLVAFFQPAIRHDWQARGWLFLFTIAMVYFAGEDINWGQYYVGWEPPQYFLENNKEQETNLHNMSSWFNQKPRLLVELWLLVACIAVPLGFRLPQRLLGKYVPSMFWPDGRIVFVAVLATLVLAIDWMAKRGIVPRAMRWSEVQEIFFAYGWLIYSFMLLGRVRARDANRGA
jgi:hypothetical protein